MATRALPHVQRDVVATISAAIVLAHRAEIERAEIEARAAQDAEMACRGLDG